MRGAGRSIAAALVLGISSALAFASLCPSQVRAQPAGDTGEPPLHRAARVGDLDAARELIGRGAAVDARDAGGRTALDAAALSDHIELVELLLERGAAVGLATNRGGSTVLHVAAQRGSLDLVRLLVSRGADVAARNDAGATPLHYAAQSRRTDAARVLLDAGADPRAASGRRGVTPLHLAANVGHAPMVELLLERGADPGTRNADGLRPADMARRNSHLVVVEILEEASDAESVDQEPSRGSGAPSSSP